MITAEYDIQLMVLERVEPHIHKSDDGRSKGSDYWVGIRNVQKKIVIHSY